MTGPSGSRELDQLVRALEHERDHAENAIDRIRAAETLLELAANAVEDGEVEP